MAPQLFDNFIRRRTEFEPYLSVAHFLQPIGSIDKLYRDGRALKLTGAIDLTQPIGRALGESLRDPEVRAATGFSIGFGQDDWFFDDTAGGLKTFVDGVLIHVALTLIPANVRARLTAIEFRKDRARTQYDDAVSLVGPVYASMLEQYDERAKKAG